MKIKLSKKEIVFLHSLLGAMSEQELKGYNNKFNIHNEKRRNKIDKFIKEEKAYNLYKKIISIVDLKDE